MSMPYVGNYAANMFNASKRYRMQFQKAVPLSSNELIEIQDVSDSFVRQLIAANFPSGSSINNGFKVVESSVTNSNNFTIKGGDGTVNGAGLLFVDGYILFLKSDIEYNQQDDSGALTDDDYTKTSIPALTTPGGARTDEVYVDFYAGEVSANAGSEYLDSSLIVSGIGTATANRLRMIQDIRVAEGGTTPTNGNDGNGIYHRYVKIATLNRTASANITTAMITDNRILVNSNYSYMNGTANSIKLVDGADIGDATHRINNLFMNSVINYESDLAFSASGSEKVRITSGGNVGIGTSPAVGQGVHVFGGAPVLLLESSNFAPANSFLIQQDTNGDSYLLNNSSAKLVLGTGGAIKMAILADGSVGIGTSNPNARLRVEGDVLITNNLTVNGTTTTVNTEVTTTDMMVINQDDNQVAFQVNQTGANSATVMEITNAGTGHALIIGNGNVGIGTNNPVTKLHLFNDLASAEIEQIIETTTEHPAYTAYKNSNGAFVIGKNSNTGSGLITGGIANGGVLHIAGSNPLQFATNGAVRTTITSGGLVGIGTVSPATPLHVYTGGSAYTANAYDKLAVQSVDHCALRLIGGATHVIGTYFGDPSNTTRGYLEYNNNLNHMAIGANSISTLTITDDGKVGIGTYFPLSKFEVLNGDMRFKDMTDSTERALVWSASDDSTRQMISCLSSSTPANDFMNIFSNYGSIRFTTSNSERMRIGNGGNMEFLASNWALFNEGGLSSATSSKPLIFGINGVEKMRLSIDGWVGIGTNVSTSPDSGLKLNVNGDVQIGNYLGGSTPSTFSLKFARSGDGNYTAGIVRTTSGGLSIYSSGGGEYLSLDTNGSLRLQPNGGSVGIGTASPAGKLDINTLGDGSYSLRLGHINTNPAPHASLNFLHNTYNSTGVLAGCYSGIIHEGYNETANKTFVSMGFESGKSSGKGRWGINTTTNTITQNISGGYYDLMVDGNGRVGIGTTSPSGGILEIRTGTITGTQSGLFVGDSNFGTERYFTINIDSTNQNVLLDSGKGGGGTIPLIINSSTGQRVGVGCTQPQTTFSVQGTSTNGIGVQGVSTTAFRCYLGLDSNNHGIMQLIDGSGNQNVQMASNADNYLIQRVGIGTSNPVAGKLHTYQATSNAGVAGFWHYASSDPYGIAIRYGAAAPNDGGHEFLICEDTSGSKMRVGSNGQIYSDAGTAISSPADLAEWTKVLGDLDDYDIGTIVQQSSEDLTVEVASDPEGVYGIVTDRAAFCGALSEAYDDLEIRKDFMALEDEELEEKYNAKTIAMTGHVVCKVTGTIKKGQRLTLSDIEGVATAASTFEQKALAFAIARQDYDSEEVGLIEVRLL
jgi:hypothetical protein